MTPSHYETSNVYLASFLLCQGAFLAGWHRASERRVVFRFFASENVHELVRLYWSRTPTAVIPLRLYTSLWELKRMVSRRPTPVRKEPPRLPAAPGFTQRQMYPKVVEGGTTGPDGDRASQTPTSPGMTPSIHSSPR